MTIWRLIYKERTLIIYYEASCFVYVFIIALYEDITIYVLG